MEPEIRPPQYMVDPAIFEQLQNNIDDDAAVRERMKQALHTLEKEGRATQSILARAHSTPSSKRAEKTIFREVETIAHLASVVSSHPYYKYNNLWTRDVQNTCFAILFCGWLGGFSKTDDGNVVGCLLTIEDVGVIMTLPVNLKEKDEFHLTIEEYLLALISLIDELARLAINAVTLGDYKIPVQISQFIKDIHAGFQILNLKNDVLRRRSDSIKYSVKKVEDVVYDLSLRNLIPKD